MRKREYEMSTIDPVQFVLVDLTNVPRTGDASMLMRLRGDDWEAINIAAQILGMRQAEFLRTACVNVAKKVISENAR